MINNAEAAPLGGRGDALLALSEADQKRLAALATIMSRGTGETPEDLLQGAYLRWLTSDVPMGEPAEIVRFLAGAIASQRSNLFRRKRMILSVLGERANVDSETGVDPVDNIKSHDAAPDERIFLQQLYNLFTDDEEVQLLLMCQAQEMSKADTMTELSWNPTRYEAVNKRKRRAIARWMREGKI